MALSTFCLPKPESLTGYWPCRNWKRLTLQASCLSRLPHYPFALLTTPFFWGFLRFFECQ